MIVFFKEIFSLKTSPKQLFDTLKWSIEPAKIGLLYNKTTENHSKKKFLGSINEQEFKITRNKNIRSPLPNIILQGSIKEKDGKAQVTIRYQLNFITFLLMVFFTGVSIYNFVFLSMNNQLIQYSLMEIIISLLVMLVVLIVLIVVEKKYCKEELIKIFWDTLD